MVFNHIIQRKQAFGLTLIYSFFCVFFRGRSTLRQSWW